MNVNFAERAHNHNWKLDPIVRSQLDTDFYKLLMLQFIWKNFPAVRVTSEILNRTVRVRLGERISAEALREQMEHVRGLRYRRSELVWLRSRIEGSQLRLHSPANCARYPHSLSPSQNHYADQAARFVRPDDA
jgi:nicotinate phosphoribosyltransferase